MQTLRLAFLMAYLLLVIASASAANLTTDQRKELIVFASKAMGANFGVQDVKDPLTQAQVEELVAAGLNLNGHLCARVVSIRALQLKSKHETTCIAYGGGEGKKTYVIDALRGVAFEQ